MKEWYLTTPVPNITSTFEDDAISEYAQSNFTDVLETKFSDDVILYNHDLSIGKNIKCVIQGNLADTQLKSMERIILAPIGTLHGGDYIFFEDNYWLVDGLPGDNKSYEKATMKVCQYKLKWQKDDGTIIERWCNLTTASKYDVGEGGNNVIFVSSNNYTILMPHDDDGQTIEEKRVFIDTSKNPHKVFKITRNDDPLFFYNSKGGVLSFIADKTELNKYADRPDLRLCDYTAPPSSTILPNPDIDGTSILIAEIHGDNDILLEFKQKYIASFKDKVTGVPVDYLDVSFKWNVICNSDATVSHTELEDWINILADDEDLIGSSILLQLIVDESVIAQKEIQVKEGW